MRSFVLGAVLTVWSAMCAVHAAPVQLVLNAPDAIAAYGQQADASSGPLEISFNVDASITLTEFVWWGYHAPGSGNLDDFLVLLNNGAPVGSQSRGVGAIATAATGNALVNPDDPADIQTAGLVRYSLSFEPGVLTLVGDNTLSLVNGDDGAYWFWQGVDDSYSPAWALYGERDQQVPEPSSLALMVGALMAAGAAARRRT